MVPYYDLDGRNISREEWMELCSLKFAARESIPGGESSPENDPTRIGSDYVGDAWVTTVWLGIDHNWGLGPPLIFETMVFDDNENDEYCRRYATREQALAGHNAVVAAPS